MRLYKEILRSLIIHKFYILKYSVLLSMSLSQIVRNSVVSALVVGMIGCGSSDPSCREGRIYKEGVGCVDETPSPYNNVDAGSRNRGSIDTYVAPQDSYVPSEKDTSVPKDTYVAPKQDTYVPPEENCTEEKFYFDGDEDGYGSNDYKWLCGPWHEYTSLDSGDCDDKDYDIFPGAKEYCNSIDDDCDGKTDESFSNIGNNCSHNYGVCKEYGTIVCDDKYNTGCSAPSPTYSDEICDGKDNDCDGSTDEGLWKNNKNCNMGKEMCLGGTWKCTGN